MQATTEAELLRAATAVAEVDEGARSFAVFLQQVEKGGLHAELSDELRRVCAELARFADDHEAKAKGTLSLTLEITADPAGIVIVKGDVKAKLPKAKRMGSAFFLTKGGNLSVENERQPRLPIREVPGNGAPARTI